MRFHGRFDGGADRALVRERLEDPSHWGALGATVEAAPGGCWLRWAHPVQLAVRVELQPDDGGLSVEMVEGGLTELSGRIDLEESAGRTSVELTLDLVFPMVVPGVLLRELDERILPAWGRALVAADQPG